MEPPQKVTVPNVKYNIQTLYDIGYILIVCEKKLIWSLFYLNFH